MLDPMRCLFYGGIMHYSYVERTFSEQHAILNLASYL